MPVQRPGSSVLCSYPYYPLANIPCPTSSHPSLLLLLEVSSFLPHPLRLAQSSAPQQPQTQSRPISCQQASMLSSAQTLRQNLVSHPFWSANERSTHYCIRQESLRNIQEDSSSNRTSSEKHKQHPRNTSSHIRPSPSHYLPHTTPAPAPSQPSQSIPQSTPLQLPCHFWLATAPSW